MNNYYKDIEHMVKMRKKQDNRNYSSLLNSGVSAQIEKLKMNKHKRGFGNIEIDYAINRLKDELDELLEEVYIISNDNGRINYWYKDDKDFSKIRHEAADIANFAHMVILKCDQELCK